MISFFRKIRQKLLSQNRVTRYLAYAIGEIVLVVIGILIALQINIQKEAADQKNETKQLLIGIQGDLKLEAERIEFLLTYYGEITDGVQKILLTYQGKEQHSNENLGKYFLNSFEFRKFSKFNTSYQALYVSGLLQEITDKKLAEDIITYYTKQYLEWSLEIYQQKAGAFNFNHTTQFYPLDKLQGRSEYKSIPNFRLDLEKEFTTDFKEFIKEPEVLNFLVDLLHQSDLVFSNLKSYQESNQILSEQIQNYIEQ
ncbi:hypothetical protein DFQ04_1678 [Algoriphagus boseongensis]|uniref:Uncharacterized protein n=1 Tax=Algoriphagus boseongensis TaxID=1442587 RepID=A0A4V3D253_9BACT|nr:hypothetical protein [Algoriphagus boseongensis]TDQ17030.1 hypothetical protein DFQ04_1678 [Algoriphagus boseongensis]